MNYNLQNLDANSFEHMIQSLWSGYFGITSYIYGAGSDGQREATFEGQAIVPCGIAEIDGYWVGQAKFKSPNTKLSDYSWLKENFEKEMEGFQTKKAANERIPDIYLFFTNIVLTPKKGEKSKDGKTKGDGIKDKMDKLLEKYRSLIPQIYVLGYDEIVRMLENNRNVATSYSSFILSGDILSCLYEKVAKKDKIRYESFLRYIMHTFKDNRRFRMESDAASNDPSGKEFLEKIYTDLDYKIEAGRSKGKFVKEALLIGNQMHRYLGQRDEIYLSSEKETGIQQDCEQTDRSKKLGLKGNKYVVKGGAGQGKSTVCQFLAQIYRATFLNAFWTQNEASIVEFLKTVEKENYIFPVCLRVPVTIELRYFSSWMAEQEREGKPCDLMSYICHEICRISSDNKIDCDTLRLYLKKFSWVFFFDGLDEVSGNSERRPLIIKAISDFIDIDLQQSEADAIVFITTRPESYAFDDFNPKHFIHLELQAMSKEDCRSYLTKLVTAVADNKKRAEETLATLNSYLMNRGNDNVESQIKYMLQSPLQARIIAMLVLEGGELPQNKYSLFQEYFNIILKREKQKRVREVELAFNKHEAQIKPIFNNLGYHLQEISARDGGDALISRDDLLALIQKKLTEEEFSEEEINASTHSIYTLIAKRTNFASVVRTENSIDYIGFSIRSIQEYLAATYLITTGNGNQQVWTDKLRKLIMNTYWRNTFFLFLEGLSQIADQYVNFTLNSILGELNGNSDEINKEVTEIHYGAQIAFSLLENHIFKGIPKYEKMFFRQLKDYCYLSPTTDILKIVDMSDNIQSQWAQLILAKPVEYLTNTDFATIGLFLLTGQNGLEDFVNAHSRKVVDQLIIPLFFSNILCSNVISILNQGCTLALKGLDIEGLLDYIDEHHEKLLTDNGRKALFQTVVKSLLTRRLGWIPIDKFSKIFSWDFNPIINILNNLPEKNEIGYGVRCCYGVPTVTMEELIPLAELAEKYGLNGLALILRTVCSRNISDYKIFFEKVSYYQDEIQLFGEEKLINKNYLMYLIWRMVCNGREIDSIQLFKEEMAVVLNTLPPITTFEDYIEASKKQYSLIRIKVKSEIPFLTIYKKILAIISEDDILLYPRLCSDIAFFYTVNLKNIYEKSKESDYCNEDITNLLSYMGTVLKFAERYMLCVKMYSPWINTLWQFAFLLNENPKYHIGYSDFPFYESESSTWSTGYLVDFSKEDSIIIVNHAIEYIRIRENTTAFAFIRDYILTHDFDYHQLAQIEWEKLNTYWNLAGYTEKKLYCLAKLIRAIDRNAVEALLEPTTEQVEIELPPLDKPISLFMLLSDEEVFSFIWKILSERLRQEKFMPLYLYALDKFRRENNKNCTKKCEEIVKDIITKQPIIL